MTRVGETERLATAAHRMDRGNKRTASEREEETEKVREPSKADMKKRRVDEVGEPNWLSNLPDLVLDHLVTYLSNNYTHPGM